MTKKPIDLWSGDLVDHYEAYAAAGTSYWADTTHYKVTVPDDKRAVFMYGSCFLSQNATCDVHIHDENDEYVLWLADHAAGTGVKNYPDGTKAIPGIPLVLEEGWYIQALFGAAQDTDAYATCVWLEFNFTSP